MFMGQSQIEMIAGNATHDYGLFLQFNNSAWKRRHHCYGCKA